MLQAAGLCLLEEDIFIHQGRFGGKKKRKCLWTDNFKPGVLKVLVKKGPQWPEHLAAGFIKECAAFMFNRCNIENGPWESLHVKSPRVYGPRG